MIYTLINASIFLIYAIYNGKKTGFFSPAFFLTAIYALIAIMGVLYYPEYELSNRIVLWPYIYLFFICILFFRPVLVYKPPVEIKVYKLQKYFLILYAVFAIINMHMTASLLMKWLQTSDWLAMKAAAYDGDLGIQGNIIQVIAGFYVPMFMPAMLIFAFYSFSDTNSGFIKSLIILLLAIVPDILVSLLYSYRGGLFTITLITLSVYFVFRESMDKNRRRKCDSLLALSGFVIIALVVSISLSRFGEDDAGGSVVAYVGQPMLVFNGGIAATANSTMGGRYFFQHIFNTSRDAIWNDNALNVSTADGAALNTFVGCSYLDFGPIMTFIIAIVVCICLSNVLAQSRNHSFSNLYLYVFYLNYLFLGVFHSTIGYARNVMLALFVFIIFRYVENNSINNDCENISMLS